MATVLLVHYDVVFVRAFINMYIEFTIPLEPSYFPELLHKVYMAETFQIILANIAHFAFALSYLSLSHKLTKFSRGEVEQRNVTYYIVCGILMAITVGIVCFYRAEVFLQF